MQEGEFPLLVQSRRNLRHQIVALGRGKCVSRMLDKDTEPIGEDIIRFIKTNPLLVHGNNFKSILHRIMTFMFQNSNLGDRNTVGVFDIEGVGRHSVLSILRTVD